MESVFSPLTRSAAVVLCLLLPVAAAAQQTPPADVASLSLQDLLDIEVISTASKFPQAIKEAPASITIVTADDIRRFGYRTLSEALKSVRGFYSTYDRNYAYVGVRGFSRPGDYNTRVLLLIDGYRLNDGIYDMAPIGTDFPIDMALIERIEVIRGPGSSLYGTNALFGVINVVTKTGGNHRGVRVEAQGGSLGTAAAAGSYGRLFGDGREMLIAASGYRSNGQKRLHFPEFDGADGTPAVAVGLDEDEAATVYGSLHAGGFAVRGSAIHRRKGIPTASFESVFGDDRESTDDDRAFIAATYDGPLTGGWLGTARLGYDYYGYRGSYPLDYGDSGVAVFEDLSTAHGLTAEMTARRRVARRHLFTVGGEVRRLVRNEQRAGDIFGEILNIDVPGTTLGVYVQDELRPAPWLLLNGGVRFDRFSSFGNKVTPRAAVVLLPGTRTAVKLLYGRAFRAPNAYERYYYNDALGRSGDLQPEQIRSTELVWEQTITKQVRTAVSVFKYDVDGIIEQESLPESLLDDALIDDVMYVNAGRATGKGFEAEAEARFDNGIAARISHTFVRTRDRNRNNAMFNAPQHLVKAGVQMPISQFVLGVDARFVGERLALDGAAIDSAFVPSVTLSSAADQRLSFSVSLYNPFNTEYADPGAEEHLQRAIRQDGRVALVRVGFAF